MASAGAAAALLITLAASSGAYGQQMIMPGRLPRLGEVDARFQSYNIEMVTVTGGRFWKPYGRAGQPDGDLFASRPPIDLGNPRLRKLAAALGPAYLRVSGSWANATYFADQERSSAAPPAGYDAVLTRGMWRGVIDFARAVNARLMTSFAVSAGSRDAAGAWKPEQAARLFAYTRALGGHIAAVEFMNEPDLAPQNAAPTGYDAAAYARDVGTLRNLLKADSPETLIAGPGSIGGDTVAASGLQPQALLAATARDLDVVSYHHYGTVSPRCGGHDPPAQALTDGWLSRTDKALAFYQALRDQDAPGKPIWLTETADAACGGSAWDATFLDSFRYLDQLGRLARAGVRVIMHNTLAGSDYGLLAEETFSPRPNYWAALLWHRLMGTTVLDAGGTQQNGLRLYAHCDPTKSGGVTLLAINISGRQQALTLPLAAMRYTLQATYVQSRIVQLNDTMLALRSDDALPDMAGLPVAAGTVTLAPTTITFLALPDAANDSCR